MVKINRILDNRKLKNIEYCKLRQKFIKNCDSLFITNCDRFLLQIATAFLLQIATKLLQIATAITNCDDFYKLRQNRCKSLMINILSRKRYNFTRMPVKKSVLNFKDTE